MSAIIRFLPGLLAAVMGYIAVRLAGLLGLQYWVTEFGLFLLVYIVVAVLADRAMKTYGK